MTIAVCGNHRVIYCTEAELVWTLRLMGHQVVAFQENQTTTEEMYVACVAHQVQLLIYVHTHGWTTPGHWTMDNLIVQLRKQGVKTASFHLDRFWGLQQHDQRETRIGQHHFWHTDVVFTADGGHQAEFAARGVNHVWLPPAVAARHLFRGTQVSDFQCDLAFVGTMRYHVEYPFRQQLIEWLIRTYGRRFRRFSADAGGTIRERRLNDLYASAKIVIGDSCFAGAPYYWSDRVPETLGRGGFLIHPETLGLGISGLITYEPGNLSDLQDKINHYLTRDEERWQHTESAMADVQQSHTYTNRMQVLLGVMGL